MRLRVLILFFIFGFLLNLSAQQWVENGALDTVKVHLQLTSSIDKIQNDINSNLRSIAYSHQKPAEILKVDWELIVSYQVYRQEKGNFKSKIFIKPLAATGDVYLYEFNASKYLLPELESFRLRIFKEDSSLVYLKYYNEQPISVSTVGQIAHFSIWHQRWSKGWYMLIDQCSFKYNAADHSFEQWFQFANNYKSANYLVDAWLKDYKDIQQTPQDVVPFLVKSLKQINYLRELYQMPFYKETILMQNDPDGLGKKMGVFATLLDLNIEKYSLLFLENQSDNSFLIEKLVSTYLAEEKILLVHSQNYTGIYDQLFKQIAKSNYPKDLTYNSFDLMDVLKIEGSEKKDNILAFENRIFEKSIFKIDELIRSEHYNEALFTIDNLESFVFNAEALELDGAFKQFKARAAYGMYNSYIEVVDKAIKIKNTKLATQYLKKADAIQKSYSKQIITNSLIDRKLKELIALYYDDFNLLLHQERMELAIAKRDTIRDLIHDFKLEEFDVLLEELNNIDSQAYKK